MVNGCPFLWRRDWLIIRKRAARSDMARASSVLLLPLASVYQTGLYCEVRAYFGRQLQFITAFLVSFTSIYPALTYIESYHQCQEVNVPDWFYYLIKVCSYFRESLPSCYFYDQTLFQGFQLSFLSIRNANIVMQRANFYIFVILFLVKALGLLQKSVPVDISK